MTSDRRGWNSTLRQGKGLNRVSDKRKAEEATRASVRVAALVRAGNRCEAPTVVPELVCWGPLDVDEVVPRGVYPKGHLDLDNVQVLCRAHHDWKHDNPEEAVKRGLRRWSWE